MSRVLTINPGSTAVKYTLFSEGGEVIDNKIFDRKQARNIGDQESKWLLSLEGVTKVSLRVVHGGDTHGPIILDNKVLSAIKENARFAPIHNSLALEIIEFLQSNLPSPDIVVSLDTDFHKDMPAKARTYAINTGVAEKHNIKRYGFHGLVVQSVLAQAQSKLGELPSKVICAHIGGGTSMTAVLNGKSVDTTMGLTPLEGLMMITRSGSVDPSIVEYLVEQGGKSVAEVISMLNNESGLYGLTGSKNTLDIITRASKRYDKEKLAVDMLVDQLVKQVFAYYGVLQGCDLLIISGGVGYGNAYLRSRLLSQLEIIGITQERVYVTQADEARVLFEEAAKL